MNINYDYYRTFYYVAKYKSFTRAAKVLNNSQPNITRTIHLLEKQLGCLLFLRSSRGVELTPEGETLFFHVSIAYNQLNVAEQLLTEEKDLTNGHIDLAVTEIALYEVMTSILKDFHDLYPSVHLKIIDCTTPEAINLVKSGKAELAVMTTPSTIDSSFEMIEIVKNEDILIAGEEFKELKDKEVSLYDLKDYPFISNSKGSQSYEIYAQLFDEYNLDFHPIIETSATNQVVNFVVNGMGLGFVPINFSRMAVNSGYVFEVKLKEKINERSICLAWDQERPMTSAVNRLIEMILNTKSA